MAASEEGRGGGAFLLDETSPREVFTPEEFTEEQRHVAKTVDEFMETEVAPREAEIEAMAPGVTVGFLRRLGELGFLGAEIPEEFGGSGLDTVASAIITEHVVGLGSFSAAFGDHTGIGTLPVLYFGTEEQKGHYLPALARGEKIGAYALTEAGAGSDALASKARAVRSPDGRAWLLTGIKQFITNAGFADLFTTYAKVDGEKFTAFLVDRDTPGLSLGPEEKKMGMRGSSTRALILEEARVPAENVLGEIGRGHVVALNILNLGRFKLAASCLGNAKLALARATRYARERVQFGKPIGEFGLIQEKLARMAAGIYGAESMIYRTAGLIATRLGGAEGRAGRETAKALEEYAVECAINKVFASELLDEAVDEMVQIFGGYGYIEEYGVERAYRDARINRIWEGTNEINRLLIPGMLLRRAVKGTFPLFDRVSRFREQLADLSPPRPEGALGKERALLVGAKQAFLLSLAAALPRHSERIAEEEEILGAVADIAIAIYAAESGLLRALKASQGIPPAGNGDLARLVAHEAAGRVRLKAREVLMAVQEGEELDRHIAALGFLLPVVPLNGVALRRTVARRVLEAGAY
jgi:alkylation response protein AidB-like acyl-CoA dehydrogenase